MVGALTAVTVGLVAVVVSGLLAAPPAGALDPDDFQDSVRVSGLTRPVAARFLPDGRALVLQKEGALVIADPAAGTRSTYFTLPNVDFAAERGAMDLALAPDFATSREVFVYQANSATKRLEINRFTFTGNGTADRNTLTSVWRHPGANLDAYGNAHMGGSLNFGPDGRIHLTIGDGLDPQNSGNLTNVFGSIVRINRNGSIPAGNPFNDGGGPNADEIYAYGLRNPFRSSFDPQTGRHYIGDVGGNDAPTAYEEVNIGQAGANYGWPACQGPLGPPKRGPDCPAGVTAPILFYDHDAGGGCCFNASITGGMVIRGGGMPAELDGAYVYADFPTGVLYFARYNGAGITDEGVINEDVRLPVWITQGPDGAIYYLNYGYNDGAGELRRIRFNGAGDNPPIIESATADPVAGAAPLNVTFTAAARDPEGHALTYEWDFGDGARATSANTTHSYRAAGTYQAVLRVTANGLTTISAPITIRVGAPPTVVIDSPSPGPRFSAGQVIRARATGTDDEPLTGASFVWNIELLHDEHQHPEVTSATGRSVTFTVPTEGHGFEGDTGYRFTVTVTDRTGLTATDSVDIRPRKVEVTITNGPADRVVLDGITVSTPFVLDTIAGFRHTVATRRGLCARGEQRTFDRWSNGANRAHTFTVGSADSRLQAFYARSGVPCAATCAGVDVTVAMGLGQVPTPGPDVILGTENADVIDGLGGNDLICGLGGDDEIAGGNGNDIILGGPGADDLAGDGGADAILGEGGPDRLVGGDGRDTLQGGPGADVVVGSAGSDTVEGNGGDDQLFGNAGADTLLGKGGDDSLTGGGGPDLLRGHVGDDRLHGKAGNDSLFGNDGADTLHGGAHDDRLAGQDGDDLLDGESGNDRLFGGLGNDFLLGGDGDDDLRGGPGDDAADGEAGQDMVAGNDGTDFLDGGPGGDTCLGGNGVDFAIRCPVTFGVP